jgi:hypothetical protein
MSPRSLAVFALLSCACHAKHKEAGSPHETTCLKTCERIHECDREADLAACRTGCEDVYGPLGDKLKDEYFAEIDQCIADARCSDLGTRALENGCRGDAAARIGAGLKVVALCNELPEAFMTCEIAAPSEEACLNSFKLFNDATIDQAMECFGEPCDEFRACFFDAIGGAIPTGRE